MYISYTIFQSLRLFISIKLPVVSNFSEYKKVLIFFLKKKILNYMRADSI
jgi:hypothetical protein